MSFVETIRQWDKGVAFADAKDWVAALNELSSIKETNSKILFNVGCLHLSNENYDAAERAFDKSICKDEHLAVAFFQRGVTFYKQGKFHESFTDFQNAFAELRGNQLIDYNLLGMRYKLHACEVLHNMALVHASLGKWEKAQESILTALKLKTESKHSHIDLALESILKEKVFELVEMKAGTLFRPRKQVVAQLENKDYMGKAKVVASVDPTDDFSGFAPLQPQTEDAPVAPRIPAVLRTLEGEPHSVLYEFMPETSVELAVLPGNIVFVLQKGVDNWATVVFNGKTGLVPLNYLAPVEINLSSKQLQNDNIPAPPVGDPPDIPKRREAISGSTQHLSTKTATKDETMGKPNILIKLHFTYNVAISITQGLPYKSFLQRVSKKLKLPIESINLSYKKCGSDVRVQLDEMEMESLWRSTQNGRLEVWCDLINAPAPNNAEEEHRQQNMLQMVALHSYGTSQPEDLELECGDIVTVISKVNEEWFEGMCKGRTGIFPASFVQMINEDKPM